MRVRILRPAFEDLASGRRFYDRRAQGIGGYFFDSLFTEIDSLSLFAGIHSVRFGYHRLLAKRFPFAVYFKVIDEEAAVFRVLDCRRDPNWIKNALDQKD